MIKLIILSKQLIIIIIDEGIKLDNYNIENGEIKYKIDSDVGGLGHYYNYKLFWIFCLCVPIVVEIILYFYIVYGPFYKKLPEFFLVPFLILVIVVQPLLIIKYHDYISKCNLIANEREFKVDFVNNPRKNLTIPKDCINQFFVKKTFEDYKLYIFVNRSVFEDDRRDLRAFPVASFKDSISVRELQNAFEKVLGLEHREIEGEYEAIFEDKTKNVDSIFPHKNSSNIDEQFINNNNLDKKEIQFPIQYTFSYTNNGFKLTGNNIPGGDLTIKDQKKLSYAYTFIFSYLIFLLLFIIVYNYLCENFNGDFVSCFTLLLFLFTFIGFPNICKFMLNKGNFRKVKEVNVDSNGIIFLYVTGDVKFINNVNCLQILASDISSFSIKKINVPSKYVATSGKNSYYAPDDIYEYGLYIVLKNKIFVNDKEVTGELFTGISFNNFKTGKFLISQFEKVLKI